MYTIQPIHYEHDGDIEFIVLKDGKFHAHCDTFREAIEYFNLMNNLIEI